MKKDWSTIKKLIWQRISAGASSVIATVTGTTPVALLSAVAKAILSLTQYGKTVQSTAPTPDSPVDIVCNNGAVKYSVQMADVNAQTVDVGHYISAQGEVLESPYNWFYTEYIPVTPNTKYTLSMDTAVYYVSISEYVNEGSGFYRRDSGSMGGNTKLTITTGANTNFVRFGANIKSANITLDDVLAIKWMLCEGENALPYAPYVDGGLYADGTPEALTVSGTDHTQTASVQNLFAVGDVHDEQNVVSGHVTRKVGVKVFDGTETFSKSSAYGKAFLINAASSTWGADRTQAVLCTHFLGLPQVKSSQDDNTCFFNQTGHFYFRVTDNSDTDAFKAWLAAQYANGTPVILLYALAEETTETVTGQSLSTAQGTNTVSVTSEVGNVDVEVQYAKTA